MDSELEIDCIDASIVILQPNQPFLDWINGLCDEGLPRKLTLENYHDECGPNTYLIPDFEELASAKRWLKKHFLIIFIEELSGWSIDENEWPEELTYKLFSKWFDIKINLMIFDLRNV